MGFDTTKANQSDLLQSLKNVSYNTETGVFIFTWWNGTTRTVDLNIEKIPVTFSMSPQGVITMVTADGTTFTADVSALIKTYTFNDSGRIDFTVTTDASGNKTVVADIVSGSIGRVHIEPSLLTAIDETQTYAEQAAESAESAGEYVTDAEAWAIGKRGGVPVTPEDETYENNSEFWAHKSEEWAHESEHTTFASLTDVNLSDLQNGDIPIYNSTSTKWVNGKILVELTQAQYDALTTEQKNADNVYYWITDASTASGFLNGKMLYSQSLTLDIPSGVTVHPGTPISAYGNWDTTETGYRIVAIGNAVAYDENDEVLEGLQIVIKNIIQRETYTLVEFTVYNNSQRQYTVVDGELINSIPDVTYYKIRLFGIRFNNNYYKYS